MRNVKRAGLGSFGALVVVAVLNGQLPIGPGLSVALGTVVLALFVWLVAWHRRLKRVAVRAKLALRLAQLGTLRLARRWSEIAEIHDEIGYRDPLLSPRTSAVRSHPYAEDLDLFGGTSLRALLGHTPTTTAVQTLRDWLSSPAEPTEIARRQSAVRALAPDFEGREKLTTVALICGGVAQSGWAVFVDWLSDPPLFRGGAEVTDAARPTLPAWSVPAAIALPALTIVLFGLHIGGGVEAVAWVWVGSLALQVGLCGRWKIVVNDYFGRACACSGLAGYHHLLSAWERHSVDNDYVAELQARLVTRGRRAASSEMKVLGRWVKASGGVGSLGHLLLMRDVHIVWGLERWRRRAARHVLEWFGALGELEALSAFATLAHDHPDWCWPELRGGEAGFEAEGLGHPLLAESVLKRSDVQVNGPGYFSLVTGSNMSGKSTLLRSIGLAAVMAQAGSVVCARRLSLTPLRTFTSMHAGDSLTDGVSNFMAELHRLKALVDAATGTVNDRTPLLYLIDEVLQGTNSLERRIAARRIVAHLLTTGAVGVVATHDLALHEDSRLDPVATKLHFREDVAEVGAGGAISFDYTLRPGLATSRNAVKLLAILGIPDPNADEPNSKV